jgi:hypothetical protein
MKLLEKVTKTEFLGREFLAWLWFRAETEQGVYDLPDGGKADLWFDGKITLQGENERGVETITCTGEAQNMKEARFALAESKGITQAMVKLGIGDTLGSYIIVSPGLIFWTFKPPRVMQDKKDDPDGLFYEKVFLIEEAVAAVNEIYAYFMKLRFDPEWNEKELPALKKWIGEGR